MNNQIRKFDAGSATAEMQSNRYLALAVVLVPAFGLGFTAVGYCTAFERSGAVLIALAISVFFQNQLLTRDIDRKELSNKAAVHMLSIKTQDKKQREKVFASLTPMNNKNMQDIPRMKDFSFYLMKVESSAGVLGTTIWGFGDIGAHLFARLFPHSCPLTL